MSISGAPARWTVRGLLLTWAVVAVIVGIGAVEKAPCASHERDGTTYASALCYSDIPVLYAERGLNLTFGWFGGEDPSFQSIEYPPLTVLYMEGTARVTHHTDGESGSPDGKTFYWMSAATLAVLGIAAIGLLCWMLGPDRSRRFLWIAAPLVIATGFINWDLLPLLLVTSALAAWRAGRPTLTGLCLGLGVAAKLYPLLLLGAIVALAVRERRYRQAAITTVATAVTWTAVNLPGYVLHPGAWRAFWHFNSMRPADLGSPWFALHLLRLDVPTSVINVVYLGWMLLACVGVLVVALRAPVAPRVEALGLLLVTAFVVMNKVNSPQYALWLLPLIALATERWRLLALWCAAEILYFVVVWQYIAYDAWWLQPVYLVAIVVRLAIEVAVACSVLRDVTGRTPDGVAARAAPRNGPMLAQLS
jgi:uncharacterized membrane protein